MINSFDIYIFRFFNDFAGKSHFLNSLIIFLANYLSYVFILALTVFIFKFSKSKKGITLITIISAFISRFVITEIIRFLYDRPRPFIDLHVTQLIPEKGASFPSGHASFFFAIAMGVYLHNKKWGIGFFILSLLIGLGRVAAGVHYPSDILGGAIVGIITSYIIFKTLNRFLHWPFEIHY